VNEFLQRLKQRKLVQWAVAYVAAAFALLQGIDIVAQQFGWPDGLRRGITLALVVGFFVTLVLAWYHGERGAQRVSGTELLIVGLVLAVGGGFLWHFAAGSRPPDRQTAAVSLEGGAPSTPAIPEKSIAVLPFDNLSDDKANAYFCEGVQDEILTRLAKVADLKVISRTSTQHLKSSPDNLPQIARQLGVAHILEGSVQKSNDQARITVQLINAATDGHLWAETFDRKLTDIFAVETEIAKTIAETLQAKLTGSETKAIADKPTANMAGYDAYLRGLSAERNRWSYEGWQEAVAAYEQAVALDPTFALAWSRLASTRTLLYFNGVNLADNSAPKIKEAADRAVSLQPDLGEAWIAQGDYRYRVARSFTGGLQAYNEARKRLPNNSLVFMSMAHVERRLGTWQDAETHYRKAAELDPRNLQIFEAMGALYGFLNRFDDAQATFDHALEIAPTEEDIHARKANLFLAVGRLEDADKELARVPAGSTNVVVRGIRLLQATYERRFDDGIALIAKVLADTKPNEPPGADAILFMVQLGYLQAWTDRPNDSKAAFTQAIHAMKPTPDSVVQADGSGLPTALAMSYAGLGEKEHALTQVRHAIEQYSDDAVGKPGAEVALAQIQAHFGDADSAIAAIPHLLEVPAGITRADLKFNPYWDPLRRDPRFQKLCEEPAK
jgi:TolB-like protein